MGKGGRKRLVEQRIRGYEKGVKGKSEWKNGERGRVKEEEGREKGEGGGERKGKNHTKKTVSEMISKNAPLSF